MERKKMPVPNPTRTLKEEKDQIVQSLGQTVLKLCSKNKNQVGGHVKCTFWVSEIKAEVGCAAAGHAGVLKIRRERECQ